MAEAPRKFDRVRMRSLLRDAADLVWRARRRLILGLPLMAINRLAGIVLPGTTKYLIDDVITKGRHDLLWKIVAIGGAASAIGAITDYALAQILGLAAQRSITELRLKIQKHVQRLPIRYFDATKTGTLVSRVMNDADGIRNLVGTGLVQLLGGLITAGIAIAILFYLSSKLAVIVLSTMLIFVVILYWAFNTVRPLFNARNATNRVCSRRARTSCCATCSPRCAWSRASARYRACSSASWGWPFSSSEVAR